MNVENNENINQSNLSMMQVVEVQANEEIDLEDYAKKILDSHQERVFVELDLSTTSNQEDKPTQSPTQSQSEINPEKVCNYSNYLK